MQQHAQFFHAEGLGDVIVGSIFHGLHGGLYGAISGDGDDDCVGAVLLDGMQRIESGGTGAHAEKNGVGAPFSIGTVENPISVLDGFCDLRVESERVGDVAAGFADGSVILNNKEVEEIGSLDLGGQVVRATEDGGVGRGGHDESPLAR